MRIIYSYFNFPILLFICLFYSFKSYGFWSVGIAKTKITPKEFIWMGGYAFRNRVAEGKINDLWAKAIYFKDPDKKEGLIITLDIESFSRDFAYKVKGEIFKKVGLKPEQIVINCSHNHSGPEVSIEQFYLYKIYNDRVQKQRIIDYLNFLQGKIIKVSLAAYNSRFEAKILSGNGTSRFQVNRYTNSESELNNLTSLNGPNDYSVPVLKITDKMNNLKGLLFGYACHNTTLSGYKWSGDYAGFAQTELENFYPGSIAMFLQGAGGDLNPLPRGTVALAKKYGKTLALAVQSVLENKMNKLNEKLIYKYSEIPLPYIKDSLSKHKLMEIKNDSLSGKYPFYYRQEADYFLNLSNNNNGILTKNSYESYPVQVFNLGGQIIFFLGGELTVGYSIDLKEIYGDNIFVFGYCNDVMSYIPTAEMIGKGGYEVTMSPIVGKIFSPKIETLIIKECIDLIDQLK